MTERFDGYEADMSTYRHSSDFEPVGASGGGAAVAPPQNTT